VTLMDIQMPNFERYRSDQPHQERIPERQDHSPIHLFWDVRVLRAIKVGAQGYILKGHVRRELLDAIRCPAGPSEYRPKSRRAG
jgi:two-component system NarL family response regulator